MARTNQNTATEETGGGSLKTRLCNFVWGCNAPMAEKLNWINYIDSHAVTGAQPAAGPTARRPTQGIKAAPAQKPRRATGTKRNRSAAMSGKAKDLLNYMQQHPTATYTSKQLAQVSPFSSWGTAKNRERSIAATARGLLGRNMLTKQGNGFALAQLRQAA